MLITVPVSNLVLFPALKTEQEREPGPALVKKS